jgi:hypothetical protein
VTVIHFDLAEAQDATNRLDDGIGLPGDEEKAAQFEAFCQQEQDRFWEQRATEEDAAWLARQCRHCGPEGSSGPDCGDCPEGDPALGGAA